MPKRKSKAASPSPPSGQLPDHLKPFASQPGDSVCLKCRRKFISPDKLRVHICAACSKHNSEVFVKDVVDIRSAGPPGPDSAGDF